MTEKILWFLLGMTAYAFLAVVIDPQTENMITHSVILLVIAGLLKFSKTGNHNFLFGMCAHAFLAGFSEELGILTFTQMVNTGFGALYIFAIILMMVDYSS